jgi:zinc protease
MTRRTLTLSMLGSAAFAQAIDRTKPPATPPLAPYKLPAVRESKLPNGLAVLMVEDRRLPMVTMRISFAAGSRSDPPNQRGLSETVASLLKAGTPKRSSRQLAEDMASIGGSLDAGNGADSLVVSGSALSEHTAKWLEAAADVVRNASFPQDEIDLRKENRLQELQMELSQASVLGNEKLRQVIFGSHPYAHTLPAEDAIKAIKREDLIGFRERLLVPGNATLIVVGALPPEKTFMDAVRANFGTWAAKPVPAPPSGEIPKSARSITLVDRPGSVQVDIFAGHQTVNRLHADYFPLIVGNTILGGGTSSRMFANLREKHGFAYHANSVHQPMKDTGLFNTVLQVREEVLEPAMTGLFSEMDKMGKEAVTSQELSNVKNFMNGSFVVSLSSQAGVASQLAALRVAGVPLQYLEQYVTRVRSVEPDQIQQVGAKYLTSSDASIVIVGDASKIGKTVEKFGKVVVEKAK